MTMASDLALRRVSAIAAIILLGSILTSAQTAAQTSSGGKSRPANLDAYSLQFWPRNSLLRGQTVRANTPYGVLTCVSIGTNQRRQCSLR